MRQFGATLCKTLQGGDLLLLSGELGAGKTTLVQFIAEELDIMGAVNSPSFLIIKEYQVKQHLILAHADLYRTHDQTDAESAGLHDLLNRNDVMTIVEWPERNHHLEMQPHIHLTLTVHDEKRTVHVALHQETKRVKTIFQELHHAYTFN